MGLLAVVASRARKFGLLPRVIKALPIVSLLCFLVGLAFLASMPLEGMFRGTYKSENALMPHDALTFYRESDWDVLRALKLEARDIKDTEDRNKVVKELFEGYGLAAYNTNPDSLANLANNTVYAVSSASRGPHNEAIVIAAPWIVDGDQFNEGGVAMTLGLARSIEKWSFLQKNLIFVLPSTTRDLRKWVEAYHTSLQHTAGSIEGAIVMEYASDREFYSSVEVLFEGLNGQLPNLDLVNVAIHCARAEGSRPEILGSEDTNGYTGRLKTMLRHISQQASAGVIPDTASAMFSGYRIDAVTLRAVFNSEFNNDITTFGRICESTARSINNLLEHFHQSFFFYLLLGTNYFVSIASYLPAAMLVAGSFSIMALYWIFTMNSASVSEAAQAGIGVALITVLSSICGYCWSVGHTLAAIASGVLLVLLGITLSFVFSLRARGVLYATALAIAGLQLSALAMVNFSLSFVVGTLMVPLSWIRPSRTPKLNIAIVVLACPAAILSTVAWYYYEIPALALVEQISDAFNDISVNTWMVIWGVWIPLWVASAIAA